MPKVDFIEKTIFNIEGINVTIKKDGKDVRGDASLPSNYKAGKMTKNSANVSYFKEKLHKQFPGYDFDVLDFDGNKQRGNVLLSTVRDTYLGEEEEAF